SPDRNRHLTSQYELALDTVSNLHCLALSALNPLSATAASGRIFFNWLGTAFAMRAYGIHLLDTAVRCCHFNDKFNNAVVHFILSTHSDPANAFAGKHTKVDLSKLCLTRPGKSMLSEWYYS